MSDQVSNKRQKLSSSTKRSSVEDFANILVGNVVADKRQIKLFLTNHGWDGKTITVNGTTFYPLLLAVGKKNHELATILVQDFFADPRAFPGTFEPLLTISCSTNETDGRKDAELASLLILRGANPHYAVNRMTALHVCASAGATQMALVLSSAMHDLNPKDSTGKTPLHHALVNQGGEDLVRILLRAGANPNMPMADGMLPLAMASSQAQYVQALVEFGAHPEQQNAHGMTALAMTTQPTQAINLLNIGARGDTADRNGVCPLHILFRLWNDGTGNDRTVDETYIQAMDRLIAQSSNLKTRDNIGRTPLHYACEQSTPCALYFTKKLTEARVPINAQDHHGWTPLHVAAASGNGVAVEFLLENGADVRKLDILGRSPLHLVGLQPIVKMSKRNGQPANTRVIAFAPAGTIPKHADEFDTTPSQVVDSRCKRTSDDALHARITSVLLDASANVLAVDKNQNYPFSFLCEAGFTTSIYTMIRRAAEGGLFH